MARSLGTGGCASHNWTACSPGARWYATNLLAELDQAGEYYIERSSRSAVARASAGMLYVQPAGPAGPDGAVVSVGQSVITLGAGTSFVSFEGLRVMYSRGTAITSLGPVANVTVTNCTVANTGAGGIGLVGSGVRVDGCEVTGTAAFGVVIKGGVRSTLTRSGNMVTGNEIHHTARFFRTGQPGLFWAGVGNTFERNHVHDVPHYAIMGGANQATCTAEKGWGALAYDPDDLGICGSALNLFEGNLIERAVYECDDSGAFNTCVSTSVMRGLCWRVADGFVLCVRRGRRARRSRTVAMC